jgi:hypothetical protein
MFKELLSKFTKFLATKEFIALVIFLILAWAIINYSTDKSLILDGMEDGSAITDNKKNGTNVPPSVFADAAANTAPVAAPAAGRSDLASVTNPSDLLPKDSNSEWAALNPVNNNNPAVPDLLQAGYHIGLDTIGQTLRNPNYQLRSDPVIPKAQVGPWNMSTIEPDLGRVPLEVGCGGK